MKKLSILFVMLLCISANIFAQDKKYGIAINESDKMIMTPCTVVDTASVMATVNNFMTPFLSLRDYVGKETDSQELLQYAIQLSEKCPSYPNEKASIVRSAQKGKIDYALKGYIDAIIAEYNKFINYISKDNGVEIEYSYSGLSQYKIYDWERAMIFGLDSIPYTTKMVMYKNPYYRPEYEDKDYLDINNQNLDAAWILMRKVNQNHKVIQLR